jgi:HPt (histidine-containing phosphotransfer) domain-containing protein
MKKYHTKRLTAFLGDDKEMLDKMITIFLSNGPMMLNIIQESLLIKDYEKLSFHAHKLKASIDHLSIESLTTEIRQIEKYAKDKISLDLLPGLVQKLEKELQETIVEIKQDFNIKS